MFKAYFSSAPFCYTKKKDWQRIVELSGIKNGGVLYELGSGTGGLALHLAKNFDLKIYGLELSYPFYLYSKIRNYLFGSKKIKFINCDFFKQNISTADYVFCYSTPRGLKKLTEKFDQELKKGAKVIIYAFAIKDWEPIVVDRGVDEKEIAVYVYEI
jgi:cyclopropane fatty-acyl-phospholipid synthase-like methyltransferase